MQASCSTTQFLRPPYLIISVLGFDSCHPIEARAHGGEDRGVITGFSHCESSLPFTQKSTEYPGQDYGPGSIIMCRRKKPRRHGQWGLRFSLLLYDSTFTLSARGSISCLIVRQPHNADSWVKLPMLVFLGLGLENHIQPCCIIPPQLSCGRCPMRMDTCVCACTCVVNFQKLVQGTAHKELGQKYRLYRPHIGGVWVQILLTEVICCSIMKALEGAVEG